MNVALVASQRHFCFNHDPAEDHDASALRSEMLMWQLSLINPDPAGAQSQPTRPLPSGPGLKVYPYQSANHHHVPIMSIRLTRDFGRLLVGNEPRRNTLKQASTRPELLSWSIGCHIGRRSANLCGCALQVVWVCRCRQAGAGAASGVGRQSGARLARWPARSQPTTLSGMPG